MEEIRAKGNCPRCSQGILSRITRKKWMRLFPKSRHYKCPSCYKRYFKFLGLRVGL